MPEIEAPALLSFKVRSTYPGRISEIREWSPEEIDLIITSYRERFPEEWQAYLDAENNNGFISNGMNDHICSVIEELFPGLHRKHYRAGAVDFRFANERTFGFTLWQPENRHLRRERRLKYIKEEQQVRNGSVEWTDKQALATMTYIRGVDHQLWDDYCETNNNIGFIGLGIIYRVLGHVAAIFPLPEDCSLRGILSGLMFEANQIHNFDMLKPANAKIRDQLESEWFNERRGYMTFEEWHQQVKLRTKNSSSKHD